MNMPASITSSETAEQNLRMHGVLLIVVSLIALLVHKVGLTEISFWIALTGSCAMLIALAIRLVRFPDRIGYADILSFGLLVAYGLGSGATIAAQDWDLSSVVVISKVPLGDLSVALSYTNIASGFLIATCLTIGIRLGDLDQYFRPPNFSTLMLFIAIVLISYYALATGLLGFMGQITDDEANRVSVVGALVSTMITPASCIAFYIACKWRGHLRIPFFIIATLLLGTSLTQGRRVIIFSAILITLILLLNRVRIGLSSKQLAMAVAIVCVALFGGTKFFYAMRVASGMHATTQPIVNQIEDTFYVLGNPSRYDLEGRISENLSERGFVLGYLALVMDRSDESGKMWGEVASFNLKQAIPSVLWEGKKYINELGSEEDFYHPHLGLPIVDSANSIYTSANIDFGLFGMLVYPATTVLIFAGITSLISRVSPGLSIAAVFFLVANTLINGETTLSTYFASQRTMIIWALIAYIYLHLRALDKMATEL